VHGQRSLPCRSPDSDVSSIGDEPLQVFRKFPDITVQLMPTGSMV
jgi:hypothetical protein